MRLNQNDETNFKIYKNNNGETHPLWDKIDDIQIILVEGKGYFEITTPVTVEELTHPLPVYKKLFPVTARRYMTSYRLLQRKMNVFLSSITLSVKSAVMI